MSVQQNLVSALDHVALQPGFRRAPQSTLLEFLVLTTNR